MITVYLDESEQSSIGKYMAVAGFFGSDQQWAALEPEWKDGLGKRKSLHMNTLRINSKPERAKQLLDRLGPLPRKHGLKPICSTVRVADYLDLIADGGLAVKALHGYTVCFGSILEALNKIVPGHESVKVVCEIQKEHGYHAYRMFRALTMRMASPSKPYFAGIEFIPKNSLLTQPADFLAFAVTHWHEDKNSLASKVCRSILGEDGTTYGYKLGRAFVRSVISSTKAYVKLKRAKW